MISKFRIQKLIDETIKEINDTEQLIKSNNSKDSRLLFELAQKCLRLGERLKTLREVMDL